MTTLLIPLLFVVQIDLNIGVLFLNESSILPKFYLFSKDCITQGMK